MSDNNIRYFKKVQKLKQISQPIIRLLDYLRILPFFIPFINFIMKALKINRKLQKDLNYRLIAKSFKNKLHFNVNQKNKTIIVPFFTGGNNLFILINYLITYRLQKKGYQSIFILCDKSFFICNNQRVGKSLLDDPSICNTCFNPYPVLSKISGMKFLKLSDFSNLNENSLPYSKVDKISTIQECKDFIFDNIPYGKFAEKSVLRYFFVGKLNDNNDHVIVYKKFLKSLIFLSDSWGNIISINKLNPDLVLLYNGTLSYETYIRFYCKKNNINYVTQETYIGEDSWIYRKNDEVMKLRWDEDWEKYKHNSLSKENSIAAEEFIKGLREGKQMYARLNEPGQMDDQLSNCDFVVLFTNLNFDTSILGRDPIFMSMIDWIENVINFWIVNEISIKLVIRIHPGELKLKTVSSDFVAPKIENLIKGHDNIILYKPSCKVDSYLLIEKMKFALIYSSTIGLEIAYMNKICLVAGSAFYNNQDFVIFKNSIPEYFSELKKLINNNQEIYIDKTNLLKFIYFIYFNRVKRLKGIKMDHVNLSQSFSFSSAEELERMNSDVLNEFENEIL